MVHTVDHVVSNREKIEWEIYFALLRAEMRIIIIKVLSKLFGNGFLIFDFFKN